jgi:hypothetical protein
VKSRKNKRKKKMMMKKRRKNQRTMKWHGSMKARTRTRKYISGAKTSEEDTEQTNRNIVKVAG